MKKLLPILLLLLCLFGIPAIVYIYSLSLNSSSTGAPPYEVSNDPIGFDINDYSTFAHWERPEGPVRVALQVGHWRTDEAPDEMERLRGNSGASGGGKSEWEVNMEIAKATAVILNERDIQVELLPTTIPPDYWADVFVSIHADGNEDILKSGFKAAAPRRDMTGKSEKLLELIKANYEESTKLTKDPNVSRNMTGYYAFRWWRFEHAIHPMTPAIILETGFLTSPADREIIVSKPELSAQGTANGIIEFLESEELL